MEEDSLEFDFSKITETATETKGLVDASKAAYGAVVYLVYEINDKAYSSQICAKSRVFLLKELSIPKLELMAASVLSTLKDTG